MLKKRWAFDKACLMLLATAIILVSANVVWASGAEGHGYRWGDFAWRVLNIILFVGILWHFIGKLATNFFRKRREDIAQSFDDLDNKRQKAKAELEAVEVRIKNLEAERKAILDESRAQAENLQKTILENAEKQAAQILENARQTAENESRVAIAQIRETIANELLAAVENSLSSRLDASTHDALINQSLNKVVLH